MESFEKEIFKGKKELKNKSGWQDSNLGPSRNSAGPDTGLGYTPTKTKKPTGNLLALVDFSF